MLLSKPNFSAVLTQIKEQQSSQTINRAKSSPIFKSGNRWTTTSWETRFKKQVNDLVYGINYSQVKGNRKATTARTSASNSLTNFKNGKSRSQIIVINKVVNPERIAIIQDNKYSTNNTQGLCKFQFQNTIQGKLQRSSSKSLEFKYQTSRPQNLNKVWAQESEPIDKRSELIKNSKNNRCHSFNSYTSKTGFATTEFLDKFYNTKKGQNLTTTSRVKGIPKIAPQHQYFDHPQDKILSQKLSLNAKAAAQKYKLKPKITTFPISPIKRELSFSRQVISPSRGCYR